MHDTRSPSQPNSAIHQHAHTGSHVQFATCGARRPARAALGGGGVGVCGCEGYAYACRHTLLRMPAGTLCDRRGGCLPWGGDCPATSDRSKIVVQRGRIEPADAASPHLILSALEHRLSEGFPHLVIAIVVHLLHHIHEAGARVLVLVLGQARLLGLEVDPAVVPVRAFDFAHGDLDHVLLYHGLAVRRVNLLVEIPHEQAVVLALEVQDLQVKRVGREAAVHGIFVLTDAFETVQVHVHIVRVLPVGVLVPSVARDSRVFHGLAAACRRTRSDPGRHWQCGSWCRGRCSWWRLLHHRDNRRALRRCVCCLRNGTRGWRHGSIHMHRRGSGWVHIH
mmetsp:Transcript_54062/g.124466  ORF Transcript_54062/g.124466 Transcript_54062/m.124466 type:complete len:336 (+) Transcript_54062:137-1144(+)